MKGKVIQNTGQHSLDQHQHQGEVIQCTGQQLLGKHLHQMRSYSPLVSNYLTNIYTKERSYSTQISIPWTNIHSRWCRTVHRWAISEPRSISREGGRGAIQYTGQQLLGQYLHKGEILQYTGQKLRYWINIHSSQAQLRCGRVILYPSFICQRFLTNYLHIYSAPSKIRSRDVDVSIFYIAVTFSLPSSFRSYSEWVKIV